jgi:hypothetical protein
MAVLRLARNERGCGTRKKGGTYLFCDMQFVAPCPSLPLGLPDRCPTCGEELEQFRGIKVINPVKYLTQPQQNIVKCAGGSCLACYPPDLGAIMWVGKKYYTATAFTSEALKMGISKRLAKIPKGLAVGDAIYFVHPEAFPPREGQVRGKPGVFLAARISAFHRIIDEAQEADADFIKGLEDQGITPVIEYDPEVLIQEADQ